MTTAITPHDSNIQNIAQIYVKKQNHHVQKMSSPEQKLFFPSGMLSLELKIIKWWMTVG